MGGRQNREAQSRTRNREGGDDVLAQPLQNTVLVHSRAVVTARSREEGVLY